MLQFFHKMFRHIHSAILCLIGAKSVGARALIIQDDKVLLVKHTYQTGWYTVGGGVKKNETPSQAIAREIFEEVGLVVKSTPHLFAVYHNRFEKRDDYVVFYIVTDFDIQESDSPEIAEKAWFPLNHLPADITPATKRRITEFLNNAPLSDSW